MLLAKSLQNRTLFLFSFAMVAILHGYVLQKINIVHQVISVKPQKKVSPIINLQRVVIKQESIVEPVIEPIIKKEVLPEPPKPVVEPIVVPPKKIKKKALKKIVKKPKIIKKKSVKKKKYLSKKKHTKKSKVAKKTSKAKLSSPKQKAIKQSYLAKVRRIIEQKKKYPKSAKRMKQEGVVSVQFTINKNGKIRHVRLEKKCPYSKLNKAAINILKKIGTFPPIPQSMGKSYLSLTIPIRYKILN